MKKNSIFIFIALLFYLKATDCQEHVIQFEPSSYLLELGQSKNISIRLTKIYNERISINFTYGDEEKIYNKTNLIKELTPIYFEAFENFSKLFELKTLDVGHLFIGAVSNETNIPFGDIFRLDIIHSKVANVFIEIIGWIYFVAWSISFYPQVVLNYRSKDVSGLSIDFLALNILGHSCYGIFNMALFWNKNVQHEYFVNHPRGVNPVLLNDVLFSIHAMLLTLITIIQTLFYRKPGHRISKISSALLLIMLLFLIISGIVCATSKLSILGYLYFFSYVKLAITIMKYIPQAYLNFKRKSTEGWSIENILLDFTGGSFSLLQMFLLAYNYNDWTSIFGSPTKLGLGLLSILFDLIFMVQHYILYRKKDKDAESYEPIS